MKRFQYILTITVLAVSLGACSNDNDKAQPTLSIQGTDPVYYNTTGRWLQVDAIGNWTLNLTFDNGVDPWCSLAPTQGAGNTPVVLSLTNNDGDNSRFAYLTLNADGKTSSLTIEQYDASKGDANNPTPPINPGGTSPSKVIKFESNPQWMELPSMAAPLAGSSAVISHSIQLGTQTVRNMTMLYDTVKFVAYWVAYPLAPNYLGEQDRTNRWAYDPNVPFAYQPNLTSGFPEKSATTGRNIYDRGHQLPSADRTVSYNANAQTFYFTNMTAQISQFNQNIWANLEGKVRAWASVADTLYVVTGAVLGQPITYTTDKDGKNIAVPQNYFKALLSLKNGTYKSIGFWFQNQAYTNTAVTSAYAKSISQLESLTGFVFFNNLPAASASTIKNQYLPQDWGL